MLDVTVLTSRQQLAITSSRHSFPVRILQSNISHLFAPFSLHKKSSVSLILCIGDIFVNRYCSRDTTTCLPSKVLKLPSLLSLMTRNSPSFLCQMSLRSLHCTLTAKYLRMIATQPVCVQTCSGFRKPALESLSTYPPIQVGHHIITVDLDLGS